MLGLFRAIPVALRHALSREPNLSHFIGPAALQRSRVDYRKRHLARGAPAPDQRLESFTLVRTLRHPVALKCVRIHRAYERRLMLSPSRGLQRRFGESVA